MQIYYTFFTLTFVFNNVGRGTANCVTVAEWLTRPTGRRCLTSQRTRTRRHISKFSALTPSRCTMSPSVELVPAVQLVLDRPSLPPSRKQASSSTRTLPTTLQTYRLLHSLFVIGLECCFLSFAVLSFVPVCTYIWAKLPE